MKKSILSSVAATILAIFPKSPPDPTPEDMQKKDFPTSTQKMGIRFNEKVRDIFRFKWLKKT